MGKKRMIYAEFFQSENVGGWNVRQRLLVLGLIANADDQGRLRANAHWLRARIFPYDDFTVDEIRGDLDAIAETNDTIAIYEGQDEKRYIQLLNWWDYQSPQWAQPSDFPPPDDWQDRIRKMVYGSKRWVMVRNWPGIDDCLVKPPNKTKETLPDGLPNNTTQYDNATVSALTNTNTNIITDSTTNLNEGSVFSHYMNNINAGMGERESEVVQEWIDIYPADWIMAAINVAVDNNVRRIVYIKKVLENYQAAGHITEKAIIKDTELEKYKEAATR